jgi:hypothetical protein
MAVHSIALFDYTPLFIASTTAEPNMLWRCMSVEKEAFAGRVCLEYFVLIHKLLERGFKRFLEKVSSAQATYPLPYV